MWHIDGIFFQLIFETLWVLFEFVFQILLIKYVLYSTMFNNACLHACVRIRIRRCGELILKEWLMADERIVERGKNMKVTADYHTHTYASDGRCGVKALCGKAKEQGLLQIAITDHSFASTIFHMTRRKLKRVQNEVSELDSDVQVLVGIEGNLVNANGDIDVPEDVIQNLDILSVGFHRFIGFKGEKRGGYDRCWLFTNGFCSKEVRQKLVDDNTQAYINAMRKFPIDVLVHLNHRALVDVKKVCDEACKQGVYVELNQKHIDALEDCIEEVLDSGVNLIVGTDAHSAKKVGEMQKILEFIEKNDIPLERVYGIDERLPKFKSKKDWTENGKKL